MRKIINNVQPSNFLLVQIIYGMRVFLAVKGNQYIGASHFALVTNTRRDMHDGTLDDTLKTQGGLCICLTVVGVDGRIFFDKSTEVCSEFIDVGRTSAQHLDC